MAPSIKEAACTRRLAQLRALLFREHQKAKRIGKIKSRMWRKINRKVRSKRGKCICYYTKSFINFFNF